MDPSTKARLLQTLKSPAFIIQTKQALSIYLSTLLNQSSPLPWLGILTKNLPPHFFYSQSYVGYIPKK